MNLKTIILSSILITLFISSKELYAQKNDTFFHINGNILTGEVKKFTKGLLYFSMKGMGTIKVENENIKSLKTTKFLRILTKDNKVYYGDIDTSENWGELKVGLLNDRVTIKVNDIVEIFPIRNTFLLRLNGRIDFGLDYNKANSMFRTNGSGQINYQMKKWSYQFKFNNNASWQKLDSVIYTSKTDFEISTEYLLSGKWRATNTTGKNTNTELGLQSRWFTGLYLKNYILQTNKTSLDYIIGISASIEQNTDDIYQPNFEAVIGGDFAIYKHKTPEISVTTNIQAFPNLVTVGRWRLDTGIDARIEIFTDFYFSFKVYYQFDSKPIGVNAKNDDYSFSTGIGYSFN